MKPFTVTVKFEPMKGLGGGFRTEWVSGKNQNLEAGIDSGGGVGNPLMTYWIQEKGEKKRRYFTVDIRDVLQQAIDATKK